MVERYQEVAADLRRRIMQGEFPSGAKVPGYRDLRVMYGVSGDVIRRALRVLEEEGLIESAPRRGITVRERGERRRLTRGTLVTRSPERGYVFPAAKSPDEPWEAHGTPRRSWEPIPSSVASHLGVDPEVKVLRRRRVTSPVGDPPFELVDTWIHPAAVDDAPQVAEVNTGPGGYLDRLEEAGHGPISWVEYTIARMPTTEEARLLRMPSSGMPVLEMTRVGHSARTGDPVEVTVVVIPADRVALVTKLERAESARWPVDPVGVS